jgi:large subunit ribosomal protein L37Ae
MFQNNRRVVSDTKMATKKVGSTGRFRAGYGKRVKERVWEIEKKQKQKQQCPFCKKFAAKRVAKGLWQCKNCGKRFTAGAYYI